VSADLVLAAVVIAGAFLVLGLAGFGNGLVALAFLPLVMSPVDAIVLLTLYTVLATVVIFVPLRADFDPSGLPALLLGSLLGTPLGVWVLAALPASTLTRLIGLVLLAIVALECWACIRSDCPAAAGRSALVSPPGFSAPPSELRARPSCSTQRRKDGRRGRSRPISRRSFS